MRLANTGTRSVVVAKTQTAATDTATLVPGGGFGNVMQTVDSTPYRGKRVRFSGWVRTEVPLPLPGFPSGQAQPWFREDRTGGRLGFFDNMNDRPIRSKDWQRFEIVGDIAADAERINFGMMLMGRGKAWLDSVAVDVVGEAGEGNQAPRKLDERGLANLIALTRLLGYVRYFHPTQAVADTDWDVFAINAIRQVEAAGSATELAKALQAVFRRRCAHRARGAHRQSAGLANRC